MRVFLTSSSVVNLPNENLIELCANSSFLPKALKTYDGSRLASLEPSYVLRALGRKDELAHSSIRFSFGRFTTEDDVRNTLNLLSNVVERLRELSPLWEMHLDGIDLDTVEWQAH